MSRPNQLTLNVPEPDLARVKALAADGRRSVAAQLRLLIEIGLAVEESVDRRPHEALLRHMAAFGADGTR